MTFEPPLCIRKTDEFFGGESSGRFSGAAPMFSVMPRRNGQWNECILELFSCLWRIDRRSGCVETRQKKFYLQRRLRRRRYTIPLVHAWICLAGTRRTVCRFEKSQITAFVALHGGVSRVHAQRPASNDNVSIIDEECRRFFYASMFRVCAAKFIYLQVPLRILRI